MMGEIVERVRKVEGPRFARSAISRVKCLLSSPKPAEAAVEGRP
jgi:hypothetical protein